MMAPYAHLVIKCARKALHPLLAPEWSMLLTCFIFITFVDFLTCQQTPNEILTPTFQPEGYDRNDAQDSFSYQDITTIVSSESVENYSQAVTTPTPQDTISNLMSLTEGKNKTVIHKPTDLRRSHLVENKIEDRVGKLVPESQLASPAGVDFIVKAPHRNELSRVTTASSSINHDDSADELRTILIETLSPSNVPTGEASTISSASSNLDPTIGAENERNSAGKAASVQDLEALELSSRKNSLGSENSIINTKIYDSSNQSSNSWNSSNPGRNDLLSSQSNPSDRPENKPPSQSSSSSSFIPNASLMDLLHIIKHLNLMTDGLKPDSKSDPVNRKKLVQGNSFLAPTVHTESEVIDEQARWSRDTWNRRQPPTDHLMPNPLRPMGFMANPANTTPELLTALDSSMVGKFGLEHSRAAISSKGAGKSNPTINRINGDTTKLDSKFKSSQGSRKPTKQSLISPYSANFESGLELLIKNAAQNRVSRPSLMEQLEAHGSSGDRASMQESRDSQKLKIGSKWRPEKSSKSKFNNQMSEDATNEDNSMTRYVTKRPPKTQKFQQEPWPKTKSAWKSISTDISIGSDVNSKRGERDIISQAQKSHSDQNESLKNTKIKQGDKGSIDSTSEAAPTGKHRKKEPPYQIHTRPESSPEHSRPILYTQKTRSNIADINSQQVPSAATSYLDDPHKKSYYWTSEQAGLYLDDFGTQTHPGPLTIGELARQHGITPLGAQSPSYLSGIGHNIHESLPVSENFGLISESNLEENFAKFPENRYRKPSIGSNHFRIDDELKKTIAIRAIEAATKHPELSAALFGGAFNFNGEMGFAGEKQPSSMANSISSIGGQTLGDFRNTNFSPLPGDGVNPLEEAFPLPDTTLASTLVAHNGLNNPIMPIAAPQDNQLVTASNSAANSTSAQAVNLVITDLANKWALSRMPDLVPIPLAATVPGYLIRLPDGKIVAAALTNLFSIQGIQRGPLTSSYKSLINNKFKGLMKQNHPSDKPSYQYGNVVAGSGLRPTVVLPPGHYPYGIMPAPPKEQLKRNRNQQREKATTVGLLSRAVLNQLGLSGSRTNHRDQSRLSKQSLKGPKTGSNPKISSNRNQSKPQVGKFPGLPFPAPPLTDQELDNLPVANPNEPVFSFADESQLIDHPSAVAPTLLHHNQLLMANDFNHQTANQFVSSADPVPLTSGSGPSLVNFRDKLSDILNNSRNIPHLGTFGGLSGEDFLNYNSKKRKSSVKPPLLTKLESILQWLASKGYQTKLARKDSRNCRDKI